ncbi:pyrimidine dimer DNA glycosylase [Ornithinimicrobium ciconiae]|uniref:Pyrimidine dimer DNA glycosylase n=1 Tax=Ornithinimicrobium ciconiae TaxID=2594265 RepID=A0A516GCN7_9MICO|nr:pyrimidine dimer DNA glycosylase/endonuclease V [Ornithinimicrobium ciconiae]QDO89272.1 pyrimidine dimer DNA glycosylase [Ornithinimicrobium ciconiae]
MRLWSLHPRYLDRPGLTAAWREALLAQAVLAGRTRGYTQHPQLARFRDREDPLASVGAFLTGVREEATARGYRFDLARVDRPLVDALAWADWAGRVAVPAGQVAYEWDHLMGKLRSRSPETAEAWAGLSAADVEVHPLFAVVPGPVAWWERPHPAP